MNMSEKMNTEMRDLSSILTGQKQAYRSAPDPSVNERKAQLTALKSALLSFQDDLVNALNKDYGQRPAQDSLIADIMPCIVNINYTIKRLNKWMKPQRRHAGLLLAPAKVEVHYQPLGVVGIMVPWNFPVMLSIGPLITALAAGNRAMIKLSEFTPNTNQVIKKMLNSIFEQNTVACIEGEADVAAEFSALPFDHLIFTGSTTVGRHVMRAAADNLTPVTLELGGKSPVIIAPDMPIDTAVERLIFGKCLNAGQICVAPDYILCPKEQVEEFILSYQKQFQAMYSDKQQNADYAHVINSTQHSRLLSWLDDAVSKGAKVVPANGQEIVRDSRALATQLVTETTDDMLIMQQEIFGPILPIISYEDISETIDYINQRSRPLALYIMSFDTETQQHLLTQTHSGGVCINETIFHVAADDAPFGGIGDSGMGQYHGKEGFLTFSKAKTVLSRGKLNIGKLVHPPYGGFIQKLMLKFFLR
ncbi:coniferyl aldehyde dehydrogenase [Colwellia psychrerythraea]|uniref:Aldehyde dehydrogenase n=1 Tax=Colwellia psychrerythraea TaxID=28229 RepID=A0A099K9V8_COLPS|nr:coniferyl aldehyde dehydrogenase [Colwellia psychrerythraea]KGJ87055.1 Coniferyl-aldehyde dehydrogenase [Colwellia psychrerythraea]